MLAIGAIAAAAGLALGLRFNVVTLILLTFAIVLIFVVGVLAGNSPLVFAFKLLATLAAVSISYLFGCLFAAHFPARSKTLGRAHLQYLGGSSARTLAH
jgi:hypothetical protein